MVFINPKGSGSVKPERVCLVTNVLDSSHDLSSYASDCNLLCLVACLLDSLMIPDLLRSAGFKATCPLTLWFVELERALCLLLVQGVVGTWICYCVGGQSIR
jgi:hypothetical protein